MTITLAAPVGYADTTLSVSGDLPYPFRTPCVASIESEDVLVTSSGTIWLVQRGYNGTGQSAHASGTEVVLTSDGVGVTPDQRAALDANTTLSGTNPVASMADAGGGIDYIQAEDPGAVGAGKTWLQPFGAFDNYGILSVRDESDTFWYQTGVGFQSDTTSIGIEVGSRTIRMVTNDTTAGLMQFNLDLDNGLAWTWAVDGVQQFSLVAPVQTPGALLLNTHPIGTQCANRPVIAPEATAADAAFNALRTVMIASGLMAPDAP